MRRSATMVMGVVLALVLAACGGGGGDTTTTTGAPPATEGTTTTTAGGGATTTTEAEPSGEPIVIGSTLSLTGFLSATGQIHKAVGEAFVEKLNSEGGLLGRPVEWLLFDDESTPDRAAALYERLITEEGVDLIIGPYGTGNITAAMAVAERYGYVFPQHTGSLTYTYTYRCQFPAWPTGVRSNITNPELVFDAIASAGVDSGTVAFVVNEFPGTQFIAYGPPDSDEGGAVKVAEDRGWDVVLEVDFPTAISDWGPIASQVRQADPDFVYLAGLGVDGPNLINAAAALGYQIRNMFVQWPAPGPLVALGEAGEGVMSVTAWEQHPPFTDDPEAAAAAEIINQALTEAGIPYVKAETQSVASWTAWEFLVEGVEGAQSLDNSEVCDYLVNNTIDTTFIGEVDFDPNQNNYYGDLSFVKQIQDGDWWVVYPPEKAAPGRSVEWRSS